MRFGQVTLPPGAVRDGEVVDVAAVSAAIRRLWREAGFKGKKVVVGLASVIVRLAEMPVMSDEELRSALRFEAQELIPIPVDDAILDFQRLEAVAFAEGAEPTIRVLLAAAQRDMVRSHVASVEGAGLRAISVDPVPFALIRSLASRPAAFGEAMAAEALVCVGGGVTTVVVHEAGIPRFVRVLSVGGDDITEAIARELDIDIDTAEDLKRRADTAADDPVVAQAGRLVAARIIPMVEEIRGSLEYYLAQTNSVPISRVVVTGGASRTVGLMQRLQQQLGERVENAHPLDGVNVGAIALSDAELAQIEPLLAVPIGLALGGTPTAKGAPRRITLMPTEVAVAQARQPRGRAGCRGRRGLARPAPDRLSDQGLGTEQGPARSRRGRGSSRPCSRSRSTISRAWRRRSPSFAPARPNSRPFWPPTWPGPDCSRRSPRSSRATSG